MKNYPKIYIYKRIVQAKLYIDDHFAEDIDLTNIADEAFFSKFHFIRLFKKIYGKSPLQYLSYVRIQKAANLLASGTSVTETCYGVGFQSLSSFSGLFRRIYGITPSSYLVRNIRLRQEIKRSPLKYIPGCFAIKNG
jgi:AraC-like DNA-binding protein